MTTISLNECLNGKDLIKITLDFCGTAAEQINNVKLEERKTLWYKIMDEGPNLNKNNDDYLKVKSIIDNIMGQFVFRFDWP